MSLSIPETSRELTTQEAEQITLDLARRPDVAVALVPDILHAMDQGVPQKLGLKVDEWLEKYFRHSASHLYRLVQQFRVLGPRVDIESLKQMPESNRYQLAHMPEEALTPRTIEDAKELKPREFNRRHPIGSKSSSKRDDRFGDPLDLPGMRRAPTNETGVVYLFGIVARHLGYEVECIHTRFPDCEAMQRTSSGKWKQVRIEFEFRSGDYLSHGHPLEGRCVIVCWKDDWPADIPKPPSLKVLELSSAIKSLPIRAS